MAAVHATEAVALAERPTDPVGGGARAVPARLAAAGFTGGAPVPAQRSRPAAGRPGAAVPAARALVDRAMARSRGAGNDRSTRSTLSAHPAHAVLGGLVALALIGGAVVAASGEPAPPPAEPTVVSAPLDTPPASVPAPPVVTSAPGCAGADCRGRNPHETGCDRDAVTVGQSLLTTRADPALPGWGGPLPVPGSAPGAQDASNAAGETVVGYVQVRWSPRCRTGWALAYATAPCAVGRLVVRRDDGAEESRVLPHLTGGDPSRGYTAMLDLAPSGRRLVGLVAPPPDGRGLVRDSTGFADPVASPGI